MKIEAVQDAVLSNTEVLKHFNEELDKRMARDPNTKKEKQHSDKSNDQYVAMGQLVNSYFTAGSKAEALPNYAAYPEGSVRQLLQELKQFQLSKAELVMILNLKPTDSVVLDVIVEELDARVPDTEDQARMLETINQILGSPLEARDEAMDVEDAADLDNGGEGE